MTVVQNQRDGYRLSSGVGMDGPSRAARSKGRHFERKTDFQGRKKIAGGKEREIASRGVDKY